MGLGDYLNGPTYRKRAEILDKELAALQIQQLELQKQLADMQVLARECGALDLMTTRRLIDNAKEDLAEEQLNVETAQTELAALKTQSSELRGQILVFEEMLLLESFALYVPKFKFNSSHEFKTRLDSIRENQKAMIKNAEAATGSSTWEVNGSKAEGRKLVNDMTKLLIRSFNNECDYCVDNVKFNNIEIGEKRIRQSFETCNRLGRVMTVRLADEFLDLKIDELRLAHEYQVKKQEEKEEAKRVREELREQQKLEQELRAAREKITKERKHFDGALKDFRARLEVAQTEEERVMLLAKISEVDASKAALDNDEKTIDYREQNAKAGYVYVISNIGAFGEGVYKIGMTRRLDPMERIDELGDASVPFWFDVHAMIFTDNAPELEAKLHGHFAAGRLNKINHRKEFFRADLSEIESVIRANYDAAVEITHEATAEQYRESLRASWGG